LNLIKLHAFKLYLENQLANHTHEFAVATADAEIFKAYKIDGYNNRVVELHQKIRETRQHLWQVNQTLDHIRENAKFRNILERIWLAPSTLEHPTKSENLT
jgi:hypothetical protein